MEIIINSTDAEDLEAQIHINRRKKKKLLTDETII